MLVHVGFAISRIDEQEAAEIFDYIKQIGELDELGESDAFAEENATGAVPERGEASS